MRKNTIVRGCTYGLTGLISLTAVIISNTTALTQMAVKPISPQTAQFIWPTKGYISQGFRKYRHEGIDIAAPSGTPVMAAAAGIVAKAGWDEWGLGNAIEIKHPNGSVTVYGHNRRLLVSKGQQVKQGQIIAEMGSTGNSTAPHLHFEIYPNGRVAVDPQNLLLASAIASNIPSPNTTPLASGGYQVNKSRPISKIPTTQAVSPSQPLAIPIHLAPATDTGCNGVTVLAGETANTFIKVCQENGQLFYIGQLKQYPDQSIKIPARNINQHQYQADNGSYSYLVSPEKVEVWRNGNQIRTDAFSTSHQ